MAHKDIVRHTRVGRNEQSNSGTQLQMHMAAIARNHFHTHYNTPNFVPYTFHGQLICTQE